MNPTRNHKVEGSIPGHRRGSDPVLLWLWHRPAAGALIRPLAWDCPYATGAAQEKAKRQKKQTKSSVSDKPESAELQQGDSRLLQ